MLESINNIFECEEFLNIIVKKISFIGQFELNEQDNLKLQDYVYAQIKRTDVKLDFVLKSFPSCLAFLLVNNAIWYYKKGQYWNLDSAFPDNNNLALQNKLGNAFLEYLAENNLKNLELEGAYRFVSSILLHAGIPQSCLPDFFTEVIWDLLTVGIVSRPEIKDYLLRIRELNSKRLAVTKQIELLKANIQENKVRVQQISNLIELYNEFSKYNQYQFDPSIIQKLPQDFNDYKEIKSNQLKNLRNEIEKYNQQKLDLEATTNLFGSKEQTLIDSLPILKTEIEKLYLYKEYEDKRTTLSANLEKARMELTLALMNTFEAQPEIQAGIICDFEEIITLYETYCDYKYQLEIEQSKRKNNWLKKMLQLLSQLFKKPRGKVESQEIVSDRLEELVKKIESELRETFGVSLKPEVFLYTIEEFTTIFRQIADLSKTYNQKLRELHIYNESLEQRPEIFEIAATLGRENDSNYAHYLEQQFINALQALKIKKNAKLASIKLRKVYPVIEELNFKMQNIERELQSTEQSIRKLGNGDLDLGISILKEIRNLEKNKKAIIKKIIHLEKKLEIPESLNNEVLINQQQKIFDELTKQKNLLACKERELLSYPIIYPYIDEPIRRFLLYGEDWAESFVIESLSLVKLASRGKLIQAKELNLPARILTWFEKWWNEGRIKHQKIEKSGQKLVAPQIKLDPVYKRLKLTGGKLRFNSDSEIIPRSLAIIITDTEGSPISNSIMLRAFLDKDGFIETFPWETDIDFLKEKYMVSICNDNKVLSTWEIDGLSHDEFLLAFTEDGQRQELNRLKKSRYWLILETGVTLFPNLRLVEEAQIVFGDASYRMVLIDLSDQSYLEFLDASNKKHKISIQDLSLLRPELIGGEEIPNVSFGNSLIFSDNLPALKVPFQEENDLSYWFLEIESENGKCLVKSKLASLNFVQTEKNGQYAYIRLIDLLVDSSLDVGLYQITITYLGQEVTSYKIAYLRGFQFTFDRKIYLPRLKEPTEEAAIIEEAIINIVKPSNAEIVINKPAKILRKEAGRLSAAVSLSEDSFYCELKNIKLSDKTTVLPLTVTIPKLKWRLLDNQKKAFGEWSECLEEIWFGELQKTNKLLFEVLLPIKKEVKVQFYLNDYKQYSVQPLKNGRAQFELSSFTDSIMSSNLPIQVFSIDLLESNRVHKIGSVIKVRSKWEVIELKYSIYRMNQGFSLRAEWREKGIVDTRSIRFWSLEEPWQPPFIQNITNPNSSLTIDHIEKIIPAGSYLVQFAEDDPWGSQVLMYPNESSNTFKVIFNYGEIYLRKCKFSFTNDNKAIIAGEFLNLPSSCIIEISLFCIIKGQLKIDKKECSCQNGKFNYEFKNKVLAENVHWVAISIPQEPKFYKVMALIQSSALEWPLSLGRDLLGKLLSLDNIIDNITLKLLYKQSSETTELNKTTELKGLTNIILKKLLDKKDFEIETNFPIQKAKIRWIENERTIYFDLPTKGVICNTCGEFFNDQNGWYAHNPRGRCKGLRVRVDTFKAQLLIYINFKKTSSELKKIYTEAFGDFLVLFSSVTNPLPDGLNTLHRQSKEFELMQMLLKRELELYQQLLEVQKSDY